MTYTADKFWNRVGRGEPDGCWPWMGRLESGPRALGYGRLDFQGEKNCYAHRVALHIARRGKVA